MPNNKTKIAPAPPQADVSAARFVLAEDDAPMTAETLTAIAPKPSAKTTSAPPALKGEEEEQEEEEADESSAATPGPPGSNAGQSSPSQDRKDKGDKGGDKDAVTIEDLTLPKSIITRLAKGVLPPNTQIQANAIMALTKSATVFINHLANAANESTLSANKKTIMPADVFKGLESIEFDFMRDRLEVEFAKFNEIQTSKRSTYRKKVAAAKKAVGPSGAGDASFMSVASTAHNGDVDVDEVDRSILHSNGSSNGIGAPAVAGSESGEARAAKKARMDPSADTLTMDMDEQDASDAETMPDDVEEDDEEEEAEEEEDEEEADEEDEDRDELEEKTEREEDEALDDDSD
ncbi:DNA polymerase epsilon subunit D [Cladorrhinum sp. PSN259]|nr:DNA polymerase epsilon subunit D [Cladorrhinum sp. PSN259]